MLSFDRGTPIAHCLDKKGNIIGRLCITEDQKKPDIMVENAADLIDDDDFAQIIKSMKLSALEVKMIKKALISKKQEDFDKLSDRLKLAVESLKDIAGGKLRSKILFEKGNEIDKLVPIIGADEVPFDRSIFLTGPSGSGKTTVACNIIKNDGKARCIVVFSRIDDDASLKPLKRLKISKSTFRDQHDGGSRMIQIRLQTEEDLLNLPSNEELKNCVVFFDDCDSFSKDIADFLNEYRSCMLESGRHFNITVLSTSHMVHNWARTRCLLNEAEWVCMFPHSNKRSSMLFLRDRMGLSKSHIESILREVMEHGRGLLCKLSAPNMILHERGLQLI